MSFTEISGKENGRRKRIVKLQSFSRFRREEGCFIIEGLRTVDDACENSIRLLELYFTTAAYEKHRTELEKFIACADFVAQISESVAKNISDTFTPQGIFAVAAMPDKTEEMAVKGKYIALENVQDPANLGAVARTAEALGLSGIILTEDSCDPFSPKSLRASMGTLLRLPLIFTSDMPQFLKKTTASTYACVAHGEAENVGEISFNSFSVAVIGNEANGLTDRTIAACDKSITIQMLGRAESLNAAAAAAIVMWEMVK